MNSLAVNISKLSFSYNNKDKAFIDNIDIKINRKDRFGLFGPNGAGKTTIMSLMTGLLNPTSGKITIFGQETGNHNFIKQSFGFVPQDYAFYLELTPIENLQFFGSWYGLSRKDIKNKSEELLDVLGLINVKNKAAKTFSGGMKRRLNIAIGVIHNPQLLFLDEPTAGVDIQSRNAIVEYLKDINEKGTTLVYTSHHLREAEELCRDIALIDEGKIIAHDELNNLLNTHQAKDLEELFLKLTGKAYRD